MASIIYYKQAGKKFRLMSKNSASQLLVGGAASLEPSRTKLHKKQCGIIAAHIPVPFALSRPQIPQSRWTRRGRTRASKWPDAWHSSAMIAGGNEKTDTHIS